MEARELVQIARWLKAHDIFRTGAVDAWANGLIELGESMEPGVSAVDEPTDGMKWKIDRTKSSIVGQTIIAEVDPGGTMHYIVYGLAHVEVDRQGDAIGPSSWKIITVDDHGQRATLAEGSVTSPHPDLVYCKEMVSITWSYMYIQATMTENPDV